MRWFLSNLRGVATGALWLALLAAPLGAGARATEVIVAQPGGSDVLDLNSCVRIALQKNESVLAERLRRQELNGQKQQALSTGLPTLDLSGEWSRSRDPSFALDESFSSSELGAPLDSLLGGFSFLPPPEAIPAQTYWRASAKLFWIVNPIKVLGAVGAANLGIHRQELAVTDIENATIEQVVTAYSNIILAQQSLAAIEADIANRQETLATLRMRHELGLATPLDTLRAAVGLANVLPEQRRARKAVSIAGAGLNALMGRAPTAPLAISSDQELELDPLDADRALELAVQRPDLAQVALTADLLRQQRKAQQAEMRPYLSVDSQYGFVGRKLGDLDQRGHDFWRATIALNVPLFDGLLTRGLVKQTEASIRRTETELAGQQRQARVQVMQILSDLGAARATLQSASLNLQQSEDVLAELNLRLQLGTTDYLSVLEAESSRSLARSNLIQARYEVLTLTASLKRAIGFSPMVPLRDIAGLVSGEAE